MMKIKKFLILLLSTMLLLSVGGLFACSDEPSTTPKNEQPEVSTGSIVLEHSRIQLTRGEKKTVNYTLVDIEEGTPEWYSFNTEIVDVDSVSGEIVGIGFGETTVVAYIGDISASCSVLVSEQAVEINQFKISLSSDQLVINADSEYNSMQIQASLTYNDAPINADILWESSDAQKVSVLPNGKSATISALENGTKEIVTATATYQGITVTACCTVVCQGAYEITFNSSEIKTFISESTVIDYDLYVDGVKRDDEKSNVVYSVENESVITVSEGQITAISGGKTKLVLSYGGREFSLDVIVYDDIYVSTASQFMDIDGQNGYVRYILQNDIDLSGYFKENPSINKSSLIDNFGAIIDGKGYTVSGWHRLNTLNDTGFKGIFNNLTSSAEIINLGVKMTVDTDVSATVISTNNSGTIKNCLFDVNIVSKNAVDSVLFETNNGFVSDTVIKINGTDGSPKAGVSDSGVATYKNTAIISSTLNYGAPNGIMVNDNFIDCYYYKTESDFINKNGYVLDGNGVGETATFVDGNYNQDIFTVSDGTIYLVNAKNSKSYGYSVVENYTYDNVGAGEQVEIKLPTANEGENVSFIVLDYAYSDVTDDVCSDGIFAAKYTGDYYVITYVEKDGLYSYAMSIITVENVKSKINATSIVLGNGTTEFEIAVEGKQASEFNYNTSNKKVATVSENGVITAVAEGTSTISVAEKNGDSFYTVCVTVVNSYTEVSDYETLKSALSNAIIGDYIVLTADITIEETPIVNRYDADGNPVCEKGIPINYAFVVETFKGIFDGQGHKIDLTFNTDRDDVLMCGLFFEILAGAEIKNLNYNFTANYIPNGKFAAYSSTFVRSCSGIIRNCYLESNLYPTTSSGGMEGIIGYLSNKSAASPTAYVYDTIFKMQTIVDGVIQDGGHAIRAATGNPYGYNSVFIRNGANNEFYGTCSFTSALEGNGTAKYNTLYDFVNGKNGYFKSVLSVITKISDGDIAYADWGGEWDITDKAIYLCGRKVADVSFEEYNVENSIAISDNRGVLSWAKEIGAVNIYINGELKFSQTENTFDIYNYLKANYEPLAGDYTVIVDSGNRAGAVIYSVIELNDDNFVSELRKMNTAEAAMYKYFVFGEDITLKSWDVLDRGDFTEVISGTPGYYVFNTIYGNIDAQGYSLNVKVNVGNSGGRFGGFIYKNYCNWQNMVYNLDATYAIQVFGLLATIPSSGNFDNCYFNINATKIDASGNVIPDTNSYLMDTSFGIKFTDCIINIKQTEGSHIYLLGTHNGVGAIFKNVIIIRNTDSSEIVLTKDPNWLSRQFINCYHYRTIEDFLNGGEGALIDVPSGVEYSSKPVDGVIAYELFGDVWTINEKEVKLVDNQIIKIFDTGDNFVNDKDIVG